MEEFLRGLLRDLGRRCEVIRTRLTAAPDDPDVRSHALGACQAIEKVRNDAVALLDDHASWVPSLVPNYLQLFKRWHERVAMVEKYPLPFVERYGAHDRRLTRLTHRLGNQVHWPLSPPLVTAFSHQYYWTVDAFNVIGAPATEGSTLLSLPDLCHELGHILLSHRPTLLSGFAQDLFAYIHHERQQIVVGQRPPEYGVLIDRLLTAWNDWWLWEFAADMVATYLVGPAFAYQHVRLCAGMIQEAYRPSLGDIATHPADDARMQGIIATLDVLGGPGVATEVRGLWDTYLTVLGEGKPADYDVCYPVRLLNSLATNVASGCRTIGLRSFADADAPSPVDIPVLMVEAWRRFRADPERYVEWEQHALERLWRELGFEE